MFIRSYSLTSTAFVGAILGLALGTVSFDGIDRVATGRLFAQICRAVTPRLQVGANRDAIDAAYMGFADLGHNAGGKVRVEVHEGDRVLTYNGEQDLLFPTLYTCSVPGLAKTTLTVERSFAFPDWSTLIMMALIGSGLTLGAKKIIQRRFKKEIESRKREIFSDLARQVSHDIRSPLSALNIAVSSLPRIPDENRKLIESSIARIQAIASALLHGTSPNHNSQVEDLHKIALSLVAEKRLEIGSKINLEFREKKSSTAFAAVNKVELERALSNLINNAIEASTPGSTVTVQLDANDKYANIVIADSGKGIPVEVLKKLGKEPISFGKEQFSESGSGLGLLHAIRTIEKSGGTLTVSSKVGLGTQIRITFPNVSHI